MDMDSGSIHACSFSLQVKAGVFKHDRGWPGSDRRDERVMATTLAANLVDLIRDSKRRPVVPVILA